ncbi:GSCOCG00005163001-RA-CDS, partial [Cotesia congregata]
ILSAFSESPRLSIIASNNLLALFFNSSIKSILVFPNGFMSFNINAVIMSNPFDSNPSPPVVDPQIQSRNIRVSDTRL